MLLLLSMKKSFLFLITLVIFIGGLLLAQQAVFAFGIPFGGKVVAITAPPPAGCAPGPMGFVISFPRPTTPCGVTWAAKFPPPPVGAWVLGVGLPTMILQGAWGF